MSSIVNKYKTTTQTFDIAGHRIKLAVVTEVEQLFDDFMLRGKQDEEMIDERIPYWADLWPSSIALAKHLIKSKVIVEGTQVLEIGCGLGLPGIVAGKLGAKVTMTDYLKPALDFAKHNWQLNNATKSHFELL